VTFPFVVPAVNFTRGPEVTLRVPVTVFVNDHTSVTVGGHVPVQVGVAVKFTVPPVATCDVAGVTLTDVRVMEETVSGAVAVAECPDVSFAYTRKV
jgi:hypothetical protein